MCHKGWAPQNDDKREARLSYVEIGLIVLCPSHRTENKYLEKLRKVGIKPWGKQRDKPGT